MDYYDNNDNQYNNPDNGPDDSYNQTGGTNRGREPKDTNRMAVISMICGIIGILALCCCVAFPLSIILGVAAITLSILSKKGMPFSGYAIAGLVLGIMSLLLGVAEGFYMILLNFMLRDPQMAPFFDQVMEQYQSLH